MDCLCVLQRIYVNYYRRATFRLMMKRERWRGASVLTVVHRPWTGPGKVRGRDMTEPCGDLAQGVRGAAGLAIQRCARGLLTVETLSARVREEWEALSLQ